MSFSSSVKSKLITSTSLLWYLFGCIFQGFLRRLPSHNLFQQSFILFMLLSLLVTVDDGGVLLSSNSSGSCVRSILSAASIILYLVCTIIVGLFELNTFRHTYDLKPFLEVRNTTYLPHDFTCKQSKVQKY